MTLAELMALESAKLEERKAELIKKAECFNDTTSLEEARAVKDELTNINTVLEERRTLAKAQAEIREMIASGEGTVLSVQTTTARTQEPTLDEIRNSREYIDAFARYIKSGDESECRAMLSTNASVGGQVPVPELVEGTIRTAWDKLTLMSKVKKTYFAGNIKIGFEISATDAAIHEEGTPAPAEETIVLGIVDLVPKMITKWIDISDEAMALNGEAFLEYIYSELTYKIGKEAQRLLLKKITDSPATANATAPGVPEYTANTLALSTVAKAIALLSDDASNCIIVMNKQTHADLKDIKYNNKYLVDPTEGLDIEYDNSLPPYSTAEEGQAYLVIGDFGHGSQVNMPSGLDIKIAVDEISKSKDGLVEFVGKKFAAVGIVADKSFVKVKK